MRKMLQWLLTAAILAGTVVVLAACGGPQAAGEKGNAKDAKPFPSKDITFVVPFSAGGGFDTYARLVAPFIQKNLPGNVNVVVKNVTGGDSIIGLMEVYKAEPDGYTIGLFNSPGQVTNQMLGRGDYDLNKVVWLGKIADTAYVAALSPKSKYKSLDDLKHAPQVKLGLAAVASGAGIGAAIAGREMGINLQLIGHDGSQEAVMAAIRGDVDMIQFPFQSVRKFMVGSQDLDPILVYSPQRLAELPDVPTVVEAGYPQLVGLVKQDYLVGTTPGVPEEVAGVLREALRKAMEDPELAQLAQNAKMPLSYAPADAVARSIADDFKNYEPFKDLIAQYTAK